MWQFENRAKEKGYKLIAGIDEAGRGPLAGPVVSAAVILPEGFGTKGINDSKKLTARKRQALFPLIKESAVAFGVGICSNLEIDRLNILQASLLSMEKAVENLSTRPDYLLVDGKFTLDLEINQNALVKGDSKSISIAAASIIAKVTRDKIMADLHEKYPVYNFKKHKGYPTKEHREAIMENGPCPLHRFSFKGVKGMEK